MVKLPAVWRTRSLSCTCPFGFSHGQQCLLRERHSINIWWMDSQCEDAALEMYEGQMYEGLLSEKRYQMSLSITFPISDVFSSRTCLGRCIRQERWIFQLFMLWFPCDGEPPGFPLSAALRECLLGDRRYISRHGMVFSSFDKCRKHFLQQRKDRDHLEMKF